jgi:tRNA dimethylallyltransferase
MSEPLSVLEAALQADPSLLVCIVGQTASGKTELGARFASRVGGEIITADSVQIYRDFDIGSGKPTAAELALAPHHMVSTIDPMSHVDAARFVGLADILVADIRARGRVPIVCGGTFLWVKALMWGLAPAPAASAEIRERHRKIATERGRAALHEALAKVDPTASARLHPNDFVRVSRALEVFESTGRKMSELQAEHGFAEARHPAKLFAVRRDPEDLRARIERRAAAFLRAGWVDEVRSLQARGFGRARAMGAVGYKEVAAHLRGEVSLDELPRAITRSTRIFARRQRTWLTHEPVTWLGSER